MSTSHNRHQKRLQESSEGFSNYFITHPKVSLLAGVAIILMGFFATLQIPKESAPYIEYGIVNISTPYAGVSAQDIDTLVTQEIESKIKSISQISKYSSVSRSGSSNITVEFNPGEDMVKMLSNIRSKVDEAKNALPSDLDNDPIITEIDSTLRPFTQVVLYSQIDPIEMTDIAEDLKLKIETLTGVSEVSLSGNTEKEINVYVNKERAESLNISIDEIIQKIRSSHSDTPLGDFEIGKMEYTLRFQGKHQTAEDIQNIVLKDLSSSGSPQIITVGDIADVKLEGEDTDSITRFGSKEGKNLKIENAVVLEVSRSGESDLFALDVKIKELVEQFAQTRFPEDVSYEFINEMAPIMKQDFQEVFQSGATSIIIVMLFIFLFVGLREGLIASMVIPLSFLSTILLLAISDRTLNFMTNFSMILALGILVDTAIVIVEGVHRFIRKGYDPQEAALLTLHEYKGALISGMLTTLAVFIPLFFLPGILGQYLSYIPITVAIVLIVSLFISLFLISAYAAQLLPAHIEKVDQLNIKTKSSFHNFRENFDQWMDKVIDQYGRILHAFIHERKKRLTFFFASALAFFLSFLIPSQFELFPTADSISITIGVEKNIGTIMEDTQEVVEVVEAEILKQEEVVYITTSINKNTASIYVELLKEKERESMGLRTSQELEAYLQKTFKNISNTDIRVQREQSGPPSEFPVGFRIVVQDRIYIDDAKKLAIEMTDLLKKEPGTSGVKNDITEIPGEFEFQINREAAIKRGIDPDSIPGKIRSAINGTTAATITKNGRDTDIVVQFAEKNLQTIEDIKNIKIYNQIPLGDIITISRQNALSEVHRRDGNISFTVSSLLAEGGNAASVTASVMEKIEKGALNIPEGVYIDDASENAENADLIQSLMISLVVAILIIFIILVTQFNSYLQPLIILQTILFSQIGVSIGLFITDTPRSLAFILGVITLAGIVVNDAIIMVDQMNKNKKEGQYTSSFDSIIEAGKARFIPVILTTLTTSAGIIPLIFIDSFWAGLAYTVIFGLSIASFLTLFITPITFYIFEEEKRWAFFPMLISICGIIAIINILSFSFSGFIIAILSGIIGYFSYQKLKKLENDALISS